MCPGADPASKSEQQDNPGGKGGRCVRLTAYHLHVPIVKKSGGLNLLESCGPVQVCNGAALPLPLPYNTRLIVRNDREHFKGRDKILDSATRP